MEQPAAQGGPEKRNYQVVAHRVNDEHPGVATITTYAFASSVEEALRLTRRKYERGGERSLYGVGLYRIVRVEELADDLTSLPDPANPAGVPA
ncbi:hypothetical protein P3T36_006394 [Kitasatospora sp. MAP12-15]|uniref:hypothetical protein n=1 Tax=unclassified Kitasatospora TaxID=2633591 RepID=UPI0024749CFC|nr:hypothetical protein [Kitasatospora sp. MAP12-44]MDH6107935.1 hypothetical protein [Kitasatospora sp. MAP12-44]